MPIILIPFHHLTHPSVSLHRILKFLGTIHFILNLYFLFIPVLVSLNCLPNSLVSFPNPFISGNVVDLSNYLFSRSLRFFLIDLVVLSDLLQASRVGTGSP